MPDLRSENAVKLDAPYLEASGGQSSNLHLNVVHFFNNGDNYTSVAA